MSEPKKREAKPKWSEVLTFNGLSFVTIFLPSTSEGHFSGFLIEDGFGCCHSCLDCAALFS